MVFPEISPGIAWKFVQLNLYTPCPIVALVVVQYINIAIWYDEFNVDWKTECVVGLV